MVKIKNYEEKLNQKNATDVLENRVKNFEKEDNVKVLDVAELIANAAEL